MQSRLFRYLMVLGICMAMSPATKAQDASRIYIEPTGWSIGTNFGLSDLWGDVGTNSAIDHYVNSKYFDKVAFMGGLFGRYTVHPCFAVRMGVNYGTVFATDKWNYDLALKASTQGDDGYQRYARSQTAKSYIFEGAFLMELNPMRFNPESKIAHKRGQPFLGAGIGVFHFEPYSTVGASPSWVKTYNLSLEGQGWGGNYPEQYSKWQMCIPIVFGYRWDLGQHLNLGIEYMYRLTFTDYLDGVSGKYVDPAEYKKHLQAKDAIIAYQVEDKGYFSGLVVPNAAGNLRGNPSNNDSYSTLSVTLYYKINAKDREWWRN